MLSILVPTPNAYFLGSTKCYFRKPVLDTLKYAFLNRKSSPNEERIIAVMFFQAPLYHLSHHTRDGQLARMENLASCKMLAEECKLPFFLFHSREQQSSPP